MDNQTKRWREELFMNSGMDEYMNGQTERWNNWRYDKHDRQQDEQTKRRIDSRDRKKCWLL